MPYAISTPSTISSVREKGCFDEREFVIIGHRGAAAYAPENTLGGVRRAIELGVDAIEVDVRKCQDGYVLMHDSTVDRTTDGRGRVSRMSLKELDVLDAGGGESIPQVNSLLSMVSPPSVVNLELKTAAASGCLEGLNFEPQRLLLSSFSQSALKSARSFRTGASLALAIGEWDPNALAKAEKLSVRYLCLDHRAVTRQIVVESRLAGLGILAYTVNSPSRVKELRRIGILGVFTDDPIAVSHRSCSLK